MRFGLGFLLARSATLNGYDIVLYGGDRSPRARPHAYREPFGNGGLAYLLLVLDLVVLLETV